MNISTHENKSTVENSIDNTRPIEDTIDNLGERIGIDNTIKISRVNNTIKIETITTDTSITPTANTSFISPTANTHSTTSKSTTSSSTTSNTHSTTSKSTTSSSTTTPTSTTHTINNTWPTSTTHTINNTWPTLYTLNNFKVYIYNIETIKDIKDIPLYLDNQNFNFMSSINLFYYDQFDLLITVSDISKLYKYGNQVVAVLNGDQLLEVSRFGIRFV